MAWVRSFCRTATKVVIMVEMNINMNPIVANGVMSSLGFLLCVRMIVAISAMIIRALNMVAQVLTFCRALMDWLVKALFLSM